MAEDSIEDVQDDVIEDVAEVEDTSSFTALAERVHVGEELSQDDIDLIGDAGVTVVREILSFYNLDRASIEEFDGDEGELILNVFADEKVGKKNCDLSVLIGYHGRCLEAFQTMFSMVLDHRMGFHYPVVIDIESYKERRRQKVTNMARSAASRAVRQHRSVSLPPMTAYERRLVHIALRDDEHVDTHSEGSDTNRHVVIELV